MTFPPSYSIIVRANQKESNEISEKSKKIQKRDKVKKRIQSKMELERLLSQVDKRHIPAGLNNPNLDDKTKRHLVQVMKNRMAAKKSREAKSTYINELEEVRARLKEENKKLAEKSMTLEQKVCKHFN